MITQRGKISFSRPFLKFFTLVSSSRCFFGYVLFLQNRFKVHGDQYREGDIENMSEIVNKLISQVKGLISRKSEEKPMEDVYTYKSDISDVYDPNIDQAPSPEVEKEAE
jgi:hypothetical protein